MRSVLIATAGLALLLAATLAQARGDRERKGNDVEQEKGMDRVTVCEVFAVVFTPDFTPIAEVRVRRGGLDPDITIDNVESLSDGPSPPGIDLCEALVEKEAFKLCKKITRRDRKSDIIFNAGYSFKKPVENLSPVNVCTGPTDPRCLDPLFKSFTLETFAANAISGDCVELLR